MNLRARYQAALQQDQIWEDDHQREVVERLATIEEAILTPRRWFSRPKPTRGLYLYGSVGVGKTFLLDLFYESLPETLKARVHFHHFMQQIDSQLRQLHGKANPLKIIANKMAKKVRVLCFDEFLVHDVAHAMILNELLQALFQAGIALVTTSNTRPDDLYLNGINRANFLPAIALIKANCDVIEIQKEQDYRLHHIPHFNAYFLSSTPDVEKLMLEEFKVFHPHPEGPGELTIQHRSIAYHLKGHDAIWFSFDVLCQIPRSQLDYLELASMFSTFFVSGVPQLTENHSAQTLLVIQLVDVLYDRGCRLILSADVPVQSLYPQGPHAASFKRTTSRLTEMQSEAYLKHVRKRVLNTRI